MNLEYDTSYIVYISKKEEKHAWDILSSTKIFLIDTKEFEYHTCFWKCINKHHHFLPT